jgi:hypothetical protein
MMVVSYCCITGEGFNRYRAECRVVAVLPGIVFARAPVILRPRSAAQQWCEFWGGRIQCENFELMVSWKDP